ncbi:unnamed protein product [Didymodactylos carnosus]|uniref:Uncharacterized protein n=1 Tax=Didymodactylos carnosus TaxID=1234261 RepID=A0A813UWX4_9BILA|nr:unnamed protein product [Didymodactylos carnosus]CAF1088664.1 unnamed protein product [Didymodactylos carnosus]CAF3620600.1 unnamed protein product [Didymodactylos carnosus]CAF3850364.1 unnamed protein product [Didymodactylos carnosus]
MCFVPETIIYEMKNYYSYKKYRSRSLPSFQRTWNHYLPHHRRIKYQKVYTSSSDSGTDLPFDYNKHLALNGNFTRSHIDLYEHACRVQLLRNGLYVVGRREFYIYVAITLISTIILAIIDRPVYTVPLVLGATLIYLTYRWYQDRTYKRAIGDAMHYASKFRKRMRRRFKPHHSSLTRSPQKWINDPVRSRFRNTNESSPLQSPSLYYDQIRKKKNKRHKTRQRTNSITSINSDDDSDLQRKNVQRNIKRSHNRNSHSSFQRKSRSKSISKYQPSPTSTLTISSSTDEKEILFKNLDPKESGAFHHNYNENCHCPDDMYEENCFIKDYPMYETFECSQCHRHNDKNIRR